jgi:hypothetical protein
MLRRVHNLHATFLLPHALVALLLVLMLASAAEDTTATPDAKEASAALNSSPSSFTMRVRLHGPSPAAVRRLPLVAAVSVLHVAAVYSGAATVRVLRSMSPARELSSPPSTTFASPLLIRERRISLRGWTGKSRPWARGEPAVAQVQGCQRGRTTAAMRGRGEDLLGERSSAGSSAACCETAPRAQIPLRSVVTHPPPRRAPLHLALDDGTRPSSAPRRQWPRDSMVMRRRV